MTDSTLGAATLHDVGTLRTSSGQRLGGPLLGIDTPTLLGVWATAPYFHDGSAPTLDDVFVVAGGTNVQAESGTVSNGAVLVTNVTNGVSVNNDDTVHNAGHVFFNSVGARLTLAGVDGGPGGVGALEIRYSVGFNTSPLEVRVNGVVVETVNLAQTGNSPPFRHTYWESVRIEGVVLGAGASNTIELSTPGAANNVSIDDVVVTTAAELASAGPHRQVLALTSTEQADLVAYLRQLDGRPPAGAAAIFADGFESGNTTAWSASVP